MLRSAKRTNHTHNDTARSWPKPKTLQFVTMALMFVRMGNSLRCAQLREKRTFVRYK